MPLRVGRRLGRFGLTVIGLALGTLIIGVALALITLSFTGSVSSNEFATTTTTVAPTTTTTTTLALGDGLQAAISTAGGSPSACATAITAGSVSLGAISFDLNNTAAQTYAPQAFLCVTNSLSGGVNEITTLTVQAIVVSSIEDACSADELTVDPDGPTDCGTAGELDSLVHVVLVPATLQDAGCFNSTQGVTLGGGPVSLLNGGAGSSALSFGATCSWEVRLQMSALASYDEKLAASTDSISLKLDVNGSNP